MREKYSYDQQETWGTHTKNTVGMWEGFIEDPNIANYNVTARNESAVHQLNSNANKAISLKTPETEMGFEFALEPIG